MEDARTVRHLDREAVHLPEQVVQIGGAEIHQMRLEGLGGRNRLGTLDGRFGQRNGLRAAPSCKGIHLGDQGIGLFGKFGLPQVLAARANRTGRTDNGLGGHTGSMRSQRNDRASGGGHGAPRGHVDYHRDRACAHRLGHGGHRKDVTARGIELQDNQLCVLLLGGLDTARQVFLGSLGYGPVDGQDQRHRC